MALAILAIGTSMANYASVVSIQFIDWSFPQPGTLSPVTWRLRHGINRFLRAISHGYLLSLHILQLFFQLSRLVWPPLHSNRATHTRRQPTASQLPQW